MTIKENVRESAKNVVKDAVKDAAKETYEEAKQSIKDSVHDTKESFKEKLHHAGDVIKDKIHSVEETYEEVKEKLEDTKERIKENIRENYEHVKDVLTDFQHEVIGGLLVLIGVLGVWLNGKLLAKAANQPRKDLLIINLAVANIALCVIAFPFPAISSYRHEWAFDDNMCKYYGFVSLLFGFVIMTTIPMIAFDEYLLFDWGAYINKRDRTTKFMIAYTWANALFWSTVPLLGWSRFAYEPSGTSCSVMPYPNEGYGSYIISCCFTCYILPLLGLYYCKSLYGERRVGAAKSTQKAVALSKRTMSLLLSFLICWTPYTIVYLWPIITNSNIPSFALSVIAPLMAKTITVVTPIIFLYTPDDAVKVD